MGFFRNRNRDRGGRYIQPIQEMLEQTWDLSKKFPVPPDSMLTTGIGLFNLFFTRLNGIVVNILKSVVLLSSMAPGLSRFSIEFKDRCLEQEKRINGISRAG